MGGNYVENSAPRLTRLRPEIRLMESRLIERSGLFEKGLALRRDHDHPIEMRQRIAKIPGGARNPRGEQLRGGVVGPFGETGFDVASGCCDLAFRKKHGGQKMMQHRIAGPGGA